MDFKKLASTLLSVANQADINGFEAEADALTLAAEGIIRMAQEASKSIHFTVTRGGKGVVAKLEVREKLPLADEFSAPVSQEALESFEFTAPNLATVKAQAAPKIEELKKKYGLEQILENISV